MDLQFEQVLADAGRVWRSNLLEIPGLKGKRPVSIWLPEGHTGLDEPRLGTPDSETAQRWPLAIFFDGQNLFGDEGTLAGGWHLHRHLSARQQAGQIVPVLIGLHHGPERETELSPWNPLPGMEGRAGLQLGWLHDWLMPRLLPRLQLNPDPAQALIGGSSLGGLLALYSLFHHPRRYAKALVMSPALWPDQFAIFQDLMLHSPHPQSQVYLDHGQREILEPGKEHLGQILFEQSQLMSDLLDVMGLTKGQRLLWHADPQGEHNEASWSRRVPAALNFLYGAHT